MKISEILTNLCEGRIVGSGRSWTVGNKDGVKSVDSITLARPLSLVLVSLSFVVGFFVVFSRH